MPLSTILALNSLRNYLQELYTQLRDPASKQIFRNREGQCYGV